MNICCYPEFHASCEAIIRQLPELTVTIKDIGKTEQLPACRLLLFPLLHACNKGNRRRLHAGKLNSKYYAWRVARGAWLVGLFLIFKPVMSTLDNRNELISGCKHSNKFLINIVLTWLVLVANLTCFKHHLNTTRHAPTPRLTFIVLFYLMIRLARGMTL